MRRSALLVTAAVGAGAVYARARARASVAEPAKVPAEWPPLTPTPRADAPAPTPSTGSDAGIAPVNDVCPEGYQIKAKSSSKIYHSPGGRNYERTIPDRCFATAEDAEAAGYRAPKS